MSRLTVLLGLDSTAITFGADRRWRDCGAVHEGWPEIRDRLPLHPSLHGEVADRIILDATHPTLRLVKPRVVCTHSDTFVLRVRRRIAEGTLSTADVALVWVEPDGTEKPIPLNDRGTPEWWPKGVFAEVDDEFHAIRRALAARDIAAAGRAEQPTIPEPS